MILLVGAGAVGTILAAHVAAGKAAPLRLYARGKDVSALADVTQMRVDHVAPAMPPLVVARPELATTLDLAGVDYLFICVKYGALAALLDQLPAIPSSCTIVSTLNGIGALRLIRQRLPQPKLAPMTVMFNGQLLGPLHARITTKAQVIVGSDDPRLLGAFGDSGMQVKRSTGDAAAWGKILINLANALCAITHTTFKDLLTDGHMRAAYVGVLDEAVGLLERAGIAYQLPMPMPFRLYRQILLRGGPLPWWFAQARNGLQEGAFPSMVADVDAGKVTEVAQLNGEIVALGAQHGSATPVNAKVVELVSAMTGKTPPNYLRPADLRARLGL